MKGKNKINRIFKVIPLELSSDMVPSSFSNKGTTELFWLSTRAKSASQHWLCLVSTKTY